MTAPGQTAPFPSGIRTTMANPPQYMKKLTTRDNTRPTQAENAPSRPKAPSPASAPPAMNPAPSTTRNPAARGSQRENLGSWLRPIPHTAAIITWAVRLSFMLP